MMYIGDSLTEGEYDMLLNLMGKADVVVTPNPDPLPCDDGLLKPPYFRPGCLAAHVCNRTVQVAFFRNDFLALDVGSRTAYDGGLLHPVLPGIAIFKPTHALLNRGAHYQQDGLFVDGIIRGLNVLLAHAPPGIQITLRNTPAGHDNCHAYTHPITTPQVLTGYHYNWEEFQRQNGLMRRIAADFSIPYLDYANMTALRPDNHASGECLHYSGAAGPVASWVRLSSAALALGQRP